MNYRNATLIAGATASGKSSLALTLAHERDGIIINADALQVYDCYRVLTARPSADDEARAPHALYGHVSADAHYSVGIWLREAIDIIQQTSKHPIIIGGTGLYFRALTQGLAEIPDIAPDIRAQVQLEFDLSTAQDYLRQHDPVIIEAIDMNNIRRLHRAIEVHMATNKPLSTWQSETPAPFLREDECECILVSRPVDELNARIAQRFGEMVDEAALDEVRAMTPFDRDLPANKALGAAELAAYLDGKMSKQGAIDAAIIATRQYAKRQRTWFRSHMKNWTIYEP